MLVAGLVVAAVVWGRDGVEAASWIAGVASLLVAVATLLITVPSGKSGPGKRAQRFSGRAQDNGQVFQAGGDITNAGNNRPPKK